jgi:hypothetical protein
MNCPADICIPSLRAIEIIRLYGLRFKIEYDFK